MAKRLPLPNASIVRSLLNYDPQTGIFTWRVARGRLAKAGSVAGCAKPCGHIAIKISGTAYLASRLAWVVMTGRDPELDPDHENGVPGDNRWVNLRLATFSQNKANSRRYRNNKSGFKGVSWNARYQKWVAQIGDNKKVIHLGYFDSQEVAYAAYLTAAAERFGEFARAA